MVNLKKWLGNPFIAAAFFTAVLIYSNAVVPADKNLYSGLVSRECLLSVTGTVSSNPVKSSSEKTYSFFVNLEKSEGKVNGYDLKSSAEGKIKVFVPASTAESLFPGKLYSSAKNKTYDAGVKEPTSLYSISNINLLAKLIMAENGSAKNAPPNHIIST